MRWALHGLLLVMLAASFTMSISCASGGADARKRPAQKDNYLRWVAFEFPFNENFLLHWPKRKMPLRIYLPTPPPGLFADPEAIHDAVRAGVMDWTGVAGPGLPRFAFVDAIEDADIPIVWFEEPDGDWYIAHCAYDVGWRTKRFGISRIIVTGRWGDGRIATRDEIHTTILHEMGHALGLGGHSPDPGDVMYPSISGSIGEGLSDRDRATLKALYARGSGARMNKAKRYP
jgi:hypothetical protein